jgi:hypothetical protein
MKVVIISGIVFMNFIISSKQLFIIDCESTSIEYIYWEYRVSICMLLKISLQESLGPALVIILMIFFCSKNTLLA